MSQSVLVMCIHFFTRLQYTTEVNTTYSLSSDPQLILLDTVYINHKNVTTDYGRARCKTLGETSQAQI